jgi:sulfate adenylyltransferase subunit 1
LSGDNVVKGSSKMPWYQGPTLLQHLEELPIEPVDLQTPPRFQVQYVIRPQSDDLHDYRGYAGSLRSGELHKDQHVLVLPAGIETTIKAIEVNRQEVETAFAPQAVVVHLSDDIDVSRGDFIVPADEVPESSVDLEATLCWMSERPLHVGDRFLLRHHSAGVKAVVKAIEYRWDVHQYTHETVERLGLNDIARVRIRTARPLFFDPYTENRNTGSFILVHEHNFDTVAAGLLHEVPAPEPITDFAI